MISFHHYTSISLLIARIRGHGLDEVFRLLVEFPAVAVIARACLCWWSYWDLGISKVPRPVLFHSVTWVIFSSRKNTGIWRADLSPSGESWEKVFPGSRQGAAGKTQIWRLLNGRESPCREKASMRNRMLMVQPNLLPHLCCFSVCREGGFCVSYAQLGASKANVILLVSRLVAQPV